MNNNQSNKPIALAVTLVILVICLMLCIMFVSKNIALKQENQVRTGKTIISLLEKIEKQATFLTTYLDRENYDVEQLDPVLLTTANEVIIYELERLGGDMKELFILTGYIKPDIFSEETRLGEAPMLKRLIDELAQVNGSENSRLYDEITALNRDIISSVERFNFKLSLSQSAMIRMSNGFEWQETLAGLVEAVSYNK